MDALNTTTEVATRLGIDSSRVRRLAVRHGIGRKIGRDWLFSIEDVDAMIEISTGKPGRPKRDFSKMNMDTGGE